MKRREANAQSQKERVNQEKQLKGGALELVSVRAVIYTYDCDK